MFKIIVLFSCVLVICLLSKMVEYASLSEQDKHVLFVQKQENEKKQIENEKIEQQKELEYDKKMKILMSESYSELKNEGEKTDWLKGKTSEYALPFFGCSLAFLIVLWLSRHGYL